jgi:hypothetical protein
MTRRGIGHRDKLEFAARRNGGFVLIARDLAVSDEAERDPAHSG